MSASTFQNFHLHTDCSHRNSAMEPIISKNTWRLTLLKVNPKRGPTRFIKYRTRGRLGTVRTRDGRWHQKWSEENIVWRSVADEYITYYILWSRVHDDHDFLFFISTTYYSSVRRDCSLIYFIHYIIYNIVRWTLSIWWNKCLTINH